MSVNVNNNGFYKYIVLTNKSYEFQSRVTAGATMRITKVEIGDGRVTEHEDLSNLSAIKHKVTDGEIVSITPQGHMVKISGVIRSDGLDRATPYREIGIYAQIGDEEILYAYINSDDKFDYIVPLAQQNQQDYSTNAFNLYVIVGDAANIEVTINNDFLPDNTITMDMLTIEVKNYIDDIKDKADKVTSDVDVHTNTSITDDDGSHGIKYDTLTNTLQYKDDDNWETIPTGQNAESLINTHKSKSILNEDGVHDLKYDKESNVFKYKESESWHDIDTGAGVKEQISTHQNKKVSDVDGVHGITFVEEEDLLRIAKQDGQVANYKAGVDPDLLFSDLNTGLDNCMEKVGRTNE